MRVLPDLLELAQLACEVAASEGVEFVDVAGWNGKSISLQLERSKFKSSEARSSSGLSVRAFCQGGVGQASSAGLAQEDAIHVARLAAQTAKLAQPDPDFIGLPSPATYREVPDMFDPQLVAYTVDDIVGILADNLAGALRVAPAAVVDGGAGHWFGENALANSLGVAVWTQVSWINTFIQVVVRQGDDVGSFYDFDYGRTLAAFNPTGIGERAAQQALTLLGARKIVSGEMPLVLGPLSAPSVFYAIAQGANAEEVQRGRSWLAGKKGQRIASDLLTLIDDPFIPGGAGSGKCDGEGYPRRVITLLEKGILKTYLHNSYTAGKAKEENTGHSTRGGIAPTNLIPVLGDKTADEIIGEVDEGIYVANGGVFPNSVTGDVSATVDSGFKIENGKLAYPIKNTMVGGGMLDFLERIDAISSDYREEPGQIMPTIRISRVKVAGGR